MTVKNIKPIQHHTANGTSKTFSFDFEVENKENIVVFIDGEPKHPSEYDYFENPRTIQFKVIPTKGSKITVQRVTSLDRSINYQTSDNSFRPEVLNKDLDRTWYAIQEINAEISDKVNQTLKINTTGNVIGGGELSKDLTITLKDQAVTPNKVFGSSTKIPSITLNQDGTVKDIGEQPATTGSTSVLIQNNSFQRAALVGDVTAALNSNTTTISNGVVSNTKLTPMPINTLKGSISLGVVQDLSVPQVQKLLNVQDGATKNQTDSYLTNRTNHTGTQPIDTVKDLPEALDSKQDNLIAGDHITIKENVITALVDVNKAYVDSELGKKLDKTANAVSASKLETPRAISITGDAIGTTDFDGSQNVSIAVELKDSGVNAGTFGSSTLIPRITVNSKGQITSVVQNNHSSASTAQAGIVQLNDTLTSTLKTQALTAAQGKVLQDTKLGKTENAVSASKLETPRRINGVLFDGTKDITIAGGEGSGGVSKDYVDQELATKLDKTANAVSASKLQTSRFISITGSGAAGSSPFDGTKDASITLSVATQSVTNNSTMIATTAFVQSVNKADTGASDTALRLKTPRNIAITGDATGNTNFDGSKDSTLNLTLATVLPTASNQGSTYGGEGRTVSITANQKGQIIKISDQSIPLATISQRGLVQLFNGLTATDPSLALSASQGKALNDNKLGKTENAVSATKLQTPRKINGVDFDGTKNINISTIPVGTINWHLGKRAKMAAGTLPLDGLLLKRADHPELWKMVEDGTFNSVTDADWLASFWFRGHFTKGDGSTTFRIPDLNGVQEGSLQNLFIRGAVDDVGCGYVEMDAIRNITGNFVASAGANKPDVTTGAFSVESRVSANLSSAGNDDWSKIYTFDASKSVPTSTENKPKSVFGIWTIVSKSAETIDPPTGVKVPVLIGGNTFDGSQKINGDIECTNLKVNQKITQKGTEIGLGYSIWNNASYVSTPVKMNTIYTNTEKFAVLLYPSFYYTGGGGGNYIRLNGGVYDSVHYPTLVPSGWTYEFKESGSGINTCHIVRANI